MGDSSAHNSLKNHLTLKAKMLSSHLLQVSVDVSSEFVQPIRNQTLKLYQRKIVLPGFKRNSVPFGYIESHFKHELDTLVKGFLFTHYVLAFLYQELAKQKILVANLPRLRKIRINDDASFSYIFELSTTKNLHLKEWKHFVFKSPKRKNYKDLDRQVSLFVKREQTQYKKKSSTEIQDGDWVFFQAILLDSTDKQELPHYSNSFWMKVSVGSIMRPFIEQLLGKSICEEFITENLQLEESFQEKVNNKYTYRIKIITIAKGQHLSIESFKSSFKLKSRADIHKKLIEVFSYRNDLSQRKSIIEEIFHLFFLKHRFEVPKHIVLRKQEDILISLRKQPDYQVYKMQRNFLQQVELLAEKQLKEEILMDQIAYNEHISVDEKDIQHYLNLFNNERLREFVYFQPILGKIEESHTPLQPSLLAQAALREKTLNFVIHTLTR